MDLAQDSAKSNDLLPEIVYTYWDAFVDWGVPEAGVNLLRILILTQINLNYIHNDKKEFPLQRKIEYIIENLRLTCHPGGAYYEAIALIFAVLQTGKTEDEDYATGLSKMFSLANEGNNFALTWVRAATERGKQSQAS